MRREAFAGSRPVARRLVEELGTVWVDSARGCLCCVFRVAPRSTLAACMSIAERVGRWSLHAPKERRILNRKIKKALHGRGFDHAIAESAGRVKGARANCSGRLVSGHLV